MLDAYIYDGLRTPFGRHGGALAPVRPDDLLAGVIRELVQRNGFELSRYEDVVIGNTCWRGCRNPWPGLPLTACVAVAWRRRWMRRVW